MKVLAVVVVVLLAGCTAITAEQRAAIRATKSGCICVASECKTVLAGSGDAAMNAATAQSLRAIQIDGQRE